MMDQKALQHELASLQLVNGWGIQSVLVVRIGALASEAPAMFWF